MHHILALSQASTSTTRKQPTHKAIVLKPIQKYFHISGAAAAMLELTASTLTKAIKSHFKVSPIAQLQVPLPGRQTRSTTCSQAGSSSSVPQAGSSSAIPSESGADREILRTGSSNARHTGKGKGKEVETGSKRTRANAGLSSESSP